jgi:hypothetical protein
VAPVSAWWLPTVYVLELTNPVQISVMTLVVAGTLLALCIAALRTPRR